MRRYRTGIQPELMLGLAGLTVLAWPHVDAALRRDPEIVTRGLQILEAALAEPHPVEPVSINCPHCGFPVLGRRVAP